MTETQTPAEIDQQLADLHEALDKARQRLEFAKAEVHYSAKDKKTYRGRYQVWGMTMDEALDAAEDIAIEDATRVGNEAQKALDRYEADTKAVAAVKAEMEPLNDEYNRRGGWTRFFLVPGGHIHATMGCTTCNNGQYETRFGWLPNLSGKTEKEAVDEHGALLCTVCFPTAPVEWTDFYEKKEAEKKAAQCPGAGRYYNRELPNRTGYYTGNWATCEECRETVTLTKGFKIRTHKAK